MGRPSKLTDETQARLVQAIRLGATYEHACNYAGLGYSTFRRWMVDGEKAQRGKFKEFWDAIKKAEGDATVGWLAKIEKAANEGQWVAAAWKLERRYPQEYGKRQAIVVQQEDKGPEVVTAGPEYTDPWMPPEDDEDGQS